MTGSGRSRPSELAPRRRLRPGLERSDVLFELAVSQVGGRSAREDQSSVTRRLPRRGTTTCASDEDSRVPELDAHLFEADVRGGDCPTHGPRWSGLNRPVTPRCSRWRSHESGTPRCGPRRRRRPACVERGVEIEDASRARARVRTRARACALARMLVRSGEIGARPMRSSRSSSRRRSSEATKAAEVMILWRLSLMEWLHRAAGITRSSTRLRHSRSRSRHWMRISASSWAGVKALIETDLGLVEEARRAGEESRPACAGDVGRGQHLRRAVGVLGPTRARARQPRGRRRVPPRHPRAGARRGGYNDPTAPVLGRCDRDARRRSASSSRPGTTSALRGNTALASETPGRSPVAAR